MSSANLLYQADASCLLSRELHFRQEPKMNMNFTSFSLTTIYNFNDF